MYLDKSVIINLKEEENSLLWLILIKSIKWMV